MNADFMNQALQIIHELMTSQADLFLSFGLDLYRGFVAIMIVWFGVSAALSGNFSMDRFVRLLLTISFGFGMVRFYNSAIPGVGYSFYELFTKQGEYLSLRLNEEMFSIIKAKLEWIWEAIEHPGINLMLAPLDMLRWAVVAGLILICYASVTFVMAFGYIATAVCVMLGPVFIPFFILPPWLNWIFWNWLKALIQYSFYPVIANAFVFVLGRMLVNFVDDAGADFSSVKLAALLVPTFVMLGTFTYGVVKIPSLVSSIFAGRSGEWAVWHDIVDKRR